MARIAVAVFRRHLAPYLADHDLHGKAQPVTIVTVVAVDEEDDGRHADHHEGEQADEDNGGMDLGADIHLPIGPDIAPVEPGPDQQGGHAEKGYQEKK